MSLKAQDSTPHFCSLSQFLNQQNLTTPTNLTMFFVAAAARRFDHAIAQTSRTATSTAFQPHLTPAALILEAAFAPPSSPIADFAGSNDADLVSFNATVGLESLLKRPTTASDVVGTSSRTTKRVVFSNPESYNSIEIPNRFDRNHPYFEYYQDTRMNLDRILDESEEYEEFVVKVRNYWRHPENFQMLSLKNQRILKMKLPEFYLTLPELDDVDNFNRNCKADSESEKYKEFVVEVQNYWRHPENFQMLSLKNQCILKMKSPEFLLTLPELDD
eukprot:scaffold31604_cov39-Cyclotella_meneghiniana.AAC.1